MDKTTGTGCKLKCNVNCCVFGCKSVRKTAPHLMYHGFPKCGQKIEFTNESRVVEFCDRRKLWETKLRMGKKVSNSMKVCSLHFTADDYIPSGAWIIKKTLKATAIPSQNLPVSQYINEKRQAKLQQTTKNKCTRQKGVTERNLSKETQLLEPDPYCSKDTLLNGTQLDAVDALLLLSQESTTQWAAENDTIEKTFYDKATQVDFCDVKSVQDMAVRVNSTSLLTISDFIKSDKELCSLTGVHSFSLFNALVFALSYVVNDTHFHRLSLYNRLFLTMMKIKLDLPYVVLSILFGVSSGTCQKIFHTVVTALGPIMVNCAIPFSSKEEIRRNLPMCFKNFGKVQIVLDCTEIFVQSHKKLCCRIKTYSHYKGTTTVKFMIGVSPAGLITYVSAPYGGRASGKIMFQQSGLLQKLDIDDEVMVDKGFLIEDLCWEYGINIVRQPFLRNKKQLSTAESLKNSKITSARVYIERTNQRIKVFKLLNNRLPVNLIPIINDIFNIVCGIVNLSNPILADDKF